MSVLFTKEAENLFVISVKDILRYDDLKEIENKGRAEIDRSGKIKLLVLAEKFSGWAKEGDWGNLTFMHEYDPYIEQVAVVAAEKWRDQILMFIGAGRRQASVEFFLPGEVEDARNWLENKGE
jgi:hypothetical protein